MMIRISILKVELFLLKWGVLSVAFQQKEKPDLDWQKKKMWRKKVFFLPFLVKQTENNSRKNQTIIFHNCAGAVKICRVKAKRLWQSPSRDNASTHAMVVNTADVPGRSSILHWLWALLLFIYDIWDQVRHTARPHHCVSYRIYRTKWTLTQLGIGRRHFPSGCSIKHRTKSL